MPAAQAASHAANAGAKPTKTVTIGSIGGAAGSAVAPQTVALVVTIYSAYAVTPHQCLDADAGNGKDGTKVQAYGCNGSPQQTWLYFPNGEMKNALFQTECLDADTHGGGANGTKLQLWTCSGTPNQQWTLPSWDPIYNPSGGDRAMYNTQYFGSTGNTVVDRDTNRTGDGAQAQLWTKNFQSQQWWYWRSPN